MTQFNEREKQFIGQRYFEMLQALEPIPGYVDFVKSLKPRLRKDRGWRAEVLAMFEINKPQHPLKVICSSSTAGAEAIFLYHGKETMLEVATVRYGRFLEKDARAACESSFSNTVGSLRKYLTDWQQVLICIIDNVAARGGKDDITSISQQMQGGLNNGWELKRPWGTALYSPMPLGLYPLKDKYGHDKIIVQFSTGGMQTSYEPPNYTKKVLDALNRKRDQHRNKKFGLKLYYFLVESGADMEQHLDLYQISQGLKPGEGLVLSSLQSVGTGHLMVTRKAIFPTDLVLDLKNALFPSVRNSDEARALM